MKEKIYTLNAINIFINEKVPLLLQNIERKNFVSTYQECLRTALSADVRLVEGQFTLEEVGNRKVSEIPSRN
jgi:hypothetical protein